MRFPKLKLGQRLPRTVDEWSTAAADAQTRLRAAAIDVAEQIGSLDLAEEMRACSNDAFPAAEYLAKLNVRSRGAGNRAHRLATRRR